MFRPRHLLNPIKLNQQQAFTLVELIIAIVVSSIIMTGVVVTSTNLSLRSADPMLSSQSIHIARAYMEEILAQDFKLLSCTPVPTRTDTNNICQTNGKQVGSIFSKARSEITEICQYREMTNVQVENQFGETPLGLCGYTVTVTVTGTGNLGPASPSSAKISNTDAALVTVKITALNGQTTELSGYATNI